MTKEWQRQREAELGYYNARINGAPSFRSNPVNRVVFQAKIPYANRFAESIFAEKQSVYSSPLSIPRLFALENAVNGCKNIPLNSTKNLIL